MSALVLPSCSDDVDNYEPTPWEYDKYAVESIRPGDDFYRFVCGDGISSPGSDAWAPLQLWQQQSNDFSDAVFNDDADNPVPAFRRITELRAQIGTADNVGKFASSLKQRLSTVASSKSIKDVPATLARATRDGFLLFYIQPKLLDGRKVATCPFLGYPFNQIPAETFTADEKQILTDAGLYDEYVAKFAQAQEMYDYLNSKLKPRQQSIKGLDASNADDCRQLVSYMRKHRRNVAGTGTSALDRFAQALGNKNPNFVPLDEATDKFFGLLDTLDESWLDKLNALIWCECLTLDLRLYVEHESSPMFVLTIISPILQVNASHYFCDTKVKAENLQRNQQTFEQLRSTLRSKIENSEWMSSTTKAGAIAKLNAMVCHTGIVDWAKYEAPVPQSQDFTSALHEIQSSHVSMLMAMDGDKVNIEDIAVLSMIMPFAGYPSYTANCFYLPNVNALFILPSTSMLVDMNKEFNMLTTSIAHEMCHGFDATGANFDEFGNFKDWWTIDDKLRFKDKQDRMVTIFDQYLAYGETYCNGKQTLEENMADLGGMEIAHAAVMQELRSKYAGKELQEQERRFFKSYAIFMAKYLSDADKEQLVTKDVHSPYEFRVNGILNNIDAWYDAFDVRRGDKYYLSPEQRVHLW